jgi:hypothetical protein
MGYTQLVPAALWLRPIPCVDSALLLAATVVLGACAEASDRRKIVVWESERVTSDGAPDARGAPVRREPVEPQRSDQCREYVHTVTIEGREQQAFGLACMEADGSWRVNWPPVPRSEPMRVPTYPAYSYPAFAAPIFFGSAFFFTRHDHRHHHHRRHLHWRRR